jgi:hypothetical protein
MKLGLACSVTQEHEAPAQSLAAEASQTAP